MSKEELKQIANLTKQNEGMEASFKSKGIPFVKLSIDSVDPETELLMLQNYNKYLKEISLANRPVKVKEEKPPVKEPIINKKVEKEDEEENDYASHKEVKPVFSTIANMEDIKRAFFSKEYETFNQLVKEYPFKYYKANYKYADDNTGRPAFVAKNLLRGFVQNLDDYRKYLMVCFRCILTNQDTKEYKYPSYWIVNSNDELKSILGSLYDDFEFIDITNQEERINIMLKRMEKNIDEKDSALVGEAYLH